MKTTIQHKIQSMSENIAYIADLHTLLFTSANNFQRIEIYCYNHLLVLSHAVHLYSTWSGYTTPAQPRPHKTQRGKTEHSQHISTFPSHTEVWVKDFTRSPSALWQDKQPVQFGRDSLTAVAHTYKQEREIIVLTKTQGLFTNIITLSYKLAALAVILTAR